MYWNDLSKSNLISTKSIRSFRVWWKQAICLTQPVSSFCVNLRLKRPRKFLDCYSDSRSIRSMSFRICCWTNLNKNKNCNRLMKRKWAIFYLENYLTEGTSSNWHQILISFWHFPHCIYQLNTIETFLYRHLSASTVWK